MKSIAATVLSLSMLASSAALATEPAISVSDTQYAALPPTAAPAATEASRAQTLFGDINPKLAELTDNVLFGDV